MWQGDDLLHFIGRMEPPTLPVTIKPIFLKMKVFTFSSTNILRYYFYAYYHKTFIKWSGIHLIFDLLDRAFIREGSSFRGGAF